jgi:hypothetical protein
MTAPLPTVDYSRCIVRLGNDIYRLENSGNGHLAVIDVVRRRAVGYAVMDAYGDASWTGRTVGLVVRAWVRYCRLHALDPLAVQPAARR